MSNKSLEMSDFDFFFSFKRAEGRHATHQRSWRKALSGTEWSSRRRSWSSCRRTPHLESWNGKGGGTQEASATTTHGAETRNADDSALPLDASVATVGSSHLVHQWRGGLALAVAGDGLDLVGVGNVRHHFPTYKNKIDELLIKQ